MHNNYTTTNVIHKTCLNNFGAFFMNAFQYLKGNIFMLKQKGIDIKIVEMIFKFANKKSIAIQIPLHISDFLSYAFNIESQIWYIFESLIKSTGW